MATTSPAHTLPSPRASPSPSSPPSPITNGQQQTASIPSPPRTKAKPTLRILCFGDSLTSGYSSAPDHPYAETLSRVLSQAFPSLHIDAQVDGVPGDVVCVHGTGSHFLNRIEPKFLTRGGGTPYDWTVVLGGTNDLALMFSAEQVFAGLRAVWAVPLSKGGRVLGCTVPEGAGLGANGQRAARRRDELNELIRNHKQEGFHVFDLHAAIPYHSMSRPERQRYWDDRIHLTPDGYDLMGEKIAAALVELIMPPGRLQPTHGDRGKQKRRRRLNFRDDDKEFEEEESGGENKLKSGWVVVRQRDLE